MNKKGIVSIALNVVAVACYVVAIITLASGGDTALGTTFLCTASALMAFGIYLSRKSRDDENEKK